MGTIQSAKFACNYQSANQRPACCRCAHVEEQGASHPPVWYCHSVGILTNANAICNRFALRSTASTAAPVVMPPLPEAAR